MIKPNRIVIVGASAAGAGAAVALRSTGYRGELILVGKEAELPYDRPPLSKRALLGEWNPESFQLYPAAQFAEMGIVFKRGRNAEELDARARIVQLNDGERLEFDALVIATGVAARSLTSIPAAENVHSIRTLADAQKLREVFEKKDTRLVIVGAGFIGTELAATARTAGLAVTLVDEAHHPLERRLGSVVGKLIGTLHSSHGVSLQMNASIEKVNWTETADRVRSLVLSDGNVVEADEVVVAVGAIPNTEWLAGSGLETGNGVQCDEYCCAAEGIYGAGDVAEWLHLGYGRRLRTEHRTNATEQAMAVAENMLGNPSPYAPMPFFWSDQYQEKLQMYGTASGVEEVRVLHGSLDETSFTLGLYAEDRLCGVLGWNAPRQARQQVPTLRSYWEKF